MIWTVLGWMVWAFVALLAVSQWATKLTNGDGGVRILAGRCACLFAAALIVTAVTPVPKLHLLWVTPVLFFGSMILTGTLMSANVARGMRQRGFDPDEYPPEERAAIETALASGDRAKAVRVITEYQSRQRDELRAQGVDAESLVGEIGRDLPWGQVVKQVFLVLEFDRGNTTVGEDGRPRAESASDRYGQLLVMSPILSQPARLPIVHRDDFLLATFFFDEPNCEEMLSDGELLVTYAPKRTLPGGKAAGFTHVLHYVYCPSGTLDRYYGFNGDVHMRKPAPEKLFGQLKYEGEVKVEVNSNPQF
jgi:hypothetical protein